MIQTNFTSIDRLKTRKRQLKLQMGIVLFFAIFGGWIGSKIFAKDFAQLKTTAGLAVYFIGTPVIFAAVFFFQFAMYRHVNRKIREQQQAGFNAVRTP